MNRTALRAFREILLIAVLLGPAGLAACGNQKERGGTIDDAASRDPSLLGARSDYAFYCIACHGRDGRGKKNLFPPLRGSKWLNGDPGIPIRVVLHGLRGEIVVEGERYMNQMPPLGLRLDDAKAAGILTYVRASWGNVAPPVTAAEVAAVREATSGRTKPFTPDELKALASPEP